MSLLSDAALTCDLQVTTCIVQVARVKSREKFGFKRRGFHEEDEALGVSGGLRAGLDR